MLLSKRLNPAILGSLLCLFLATQSNAWLFGSNKKKPEATLVQSSADSGAKTNATFIDSLNAGKEITLADKDFHAKPEIAAQEKPKTAGAATTVFSIQVLASSQMETVRQEKTNLENKLKLSVYIKAESPYFKLLAGSFPDRESALPTVEKLKSLGYHDAFVVRIPSKTE